MIRNEKKELEEKKQQYIVFRNQLKDLNKKLKNIENRKKQEIKEIEFNGSNISEIEEQAKRMQQVAIQLKSEEDEVQKDVDATREYINRLAIDIKVLRVKLESIEGLEKEINELKLEIAEKKKQNVAYLKASSRLEEVLSEVSVISEMGKRDIQKIIDRVDRKKLKG